MESIVTAVISAAASIVVALINHGRLRGRSSSIPLTSATRQQRRGRMWMLSVIALVCWVLVAPLFTSSQHANVLVANFSGIVPILSVILAYVCAPAPLAAASGVFAIHAVNAGVMSFSKVAGFRVASTSDVLILLAIFTVNATVAAFAARWALSRRTRLDAPIDSVPADTAPATSPTGALLATQLSELARLRKEGSLTEEEYAKAKSQLLA